MPWTKVACTTSGCTAEFAVDDELQQRDCHVCGTTHTAPWGPQAVDGSRSTREAARKAKARRDAVSSSPTTIDVEIDGLEAKHITNAADAVGKDPAEFVLSAAVAKATADLRVEHPGTAEDVHKRAVVKILRERGRVAPCDLYDEYRRHVDAPRTKRTVRSYLADLADEGRVRAYGAGPGRAYSWVG